MKKNISINLYGTIYQIDEDAYDLLERYLDSMKSYFSRKEGGDEIADDIEHRVAELLWEKREAGEEAVNIETIKEIIGKIGDPEQIDSEETAESSAEDQPGTYNGNADDGLNSHPFADGGSDSGSTGEKSEFKENDNYYKSDNIFDRIGKNMKGRRLYRDIYTNVIGGVCSGLAKYIGGDPTLWRLGAVFGTIILFIMSGWFLVPGIVGWAIPIAYIVLWIVLPVARTPEDMLRMRGEDVNPQNLNQEILNESEGKARQQQQYYYPQSSNDGCMKAAGVGCLVVLALVFIFIFLPVIFVVIVMGGLTTSGMFGGDSLMGNLFGSSQVMIWAIIFCILMVLLIPVFFIVRMLVGSNKRTSTIVIVIALIIWLISLIAGIFLISNRVGNAINIIDETEAVEDTFMWDDDEIDDYAEPDTTAIDTLVDDTALVADEPVNVSAGTSGVSISTPDANISVSPKGVRIHAMRGSRGNHGNS